MAELPQEMGYQRQSNGKGCWECQQRCWECGKGGWERCWRSCGCAVLLLWANPGPELVAFGGAADETVNSTGCSRQLSQGLHSLPRGMSSSSSLEGSQSWEALKLSMLWLERSTTSFPQKVSGISVLKQNISDFHGSIEVSEGKRK